MNKLINKVDVIIEICKFLENRDVLKLLTMQIFRNVFNVSQNLLSRKIALRAASYPEDFPWTHFIGSINNQAITDGIDIAKFAALVPLEYNNDKRHMPNKHMFDMRGYMYYWRSKNMLSQIIHDLKYFKYVSGSELYFPKEHFSKDAIISNYNYYHYVDYIEDAKKEQVKNCKLIMRDYLVDNMDIRITNGLIELRLFACSNICIYGNVDTILISESSNINLYGEYDDVTIDDSNNVFINRVNKCSIEAYHSAKYIIAECKKFMIECTSDNKNFDNLHINGFRGLSGVENLTICTKRCNLNNMENLKVLYADYVHDDEQSTYELVINNCPNLEYVHTIYTDSIIVNCPKLIAISVDFECRFLTLRNLPKLKAFSIEYTAVVMENCPAVEEIFYTENGFFNMDNESGRDIYTDAKFMKIRRIYLTDEVLDNYNYRDYIPDGIYPEILKMHNEVKKESKYFAPYLRCRDE